MSESQETQAARRAPQHAGGWLMLACGILLSGLGHWLVSSPSPQGLKPAVPFRSTIDINQASVAELCCIPHVGPSLAEKIVRFRQEHGPFHSLTELERVPGIGPNLRLEIAQAIDPLGDHQP